MQMLHNTEILYLIVGVQNVMSKPAISVVLDDPIRFLDERKLLFATVPDEGGVIGKWGQIMN